ncbi:MAG: ATP-dependent RecD-like DNA helicase, partial [Simkaniaceae bacterium]|nr:ATP-dependent RecD-like DNA helicase [Simkaniaceae bacterium]
MNECVTGFIESIVFSSEENGFTIARLKEPRKNELTTILGEMPSIKEGETIHCNGIWKRHPKHGPQFEVKTFELKAPEDLYGIQKYLESGLIKGIGPVYAEKIVKHFKLDTLDVIDKSPHRLSEIPGIGLKRIELIQTCWLDQRSIRDLMIFLQSHNVRSSLAQKVYKLYGENSIEKIKENPYALAKTIFGVGFKSADDLAQNLGIAVDSPHRIQAGIEYLLWELSSSGHVCYREADLIPRTVDLLLVDALLIEKQIMELEKEGSIVCSKLDNEAYVWV